VPFFPLGGFTPLQSTTFSDVAARLGATPMQVALAWLLQRPTNSMLIPGTSSIEHLRENLRSSMLQIPPEVIADLGAIGGSTKSEAHSGRLVLRDPQRLHVGLWAKVVRSRNLEVRSVIETQCQPRSVGPLSCSRWDRVSFSEQQQPPMPDRSCVLTRGWCCNFWRLNESTFRV